MDTEQYPMGQDDKKWDRPWTSDEIRKNSANWTLAGDVGLYHLLSEFSQKIILRSHEVGNAVDGLVHKTKMASIKVNNIINDFHMLSNLQFVENRVYDEELQENTAVTKPMEKTKEQREVEMLPKIVQAVELGLKVLDQAFNRISVNEISDSEDEDLSSEGRTILEPKDPYEHRPLPFVIGSEEFQNCDYAGLKELIEEDIEPSVEVESSISDTDETSSSDEEDLPFDGDQVDKFTSDQKVQSISDQISSSDESELFGSEKQENGFVSDSSFDSKMKEGKHVQRLNEEIKVAVKEGRQSSVSSMQAKLKLPQVLPVSKGPEKKKESDDLFANADLSDDDSPFRKKTGLFSADVRFDDEADMFNDDLFGGKAKESKSAESPKAPPTKATSALQKKKDEPSLFSNDEESDDDIFNTLAKSKTPVVPKETKSYKKLGTALPGLSDRKKDSMFEDNDASDQSYKKLGTALPGLTDRKKDSMFEDNDSSDQVETKKSPDQTDSTATTPSSALSIKSNRGFDFGGGGGGHSDSLFGDESDQDDLFSSKKTSKKFGFDATEEDDDLFGLVGGKSSKKPEVSESKKDMKADEEKSSLFEESQEVDQSYKKIGMPLPGLVPNKKQDSMFTDNASLDKPKKSYQKLGTALPGLTNKKKGSMFDDTDGSDQEEKKKQSTIKTSPAPVVKKEAKKISLFDDDGDDDIFSQEPRQLLSPGKSPSVKNQSEKVLPVKEKEVEIKAVPTSKSANKNKGLFDDEDDDDIDFMKGVKTAPTVVPSTKKNAISFLEESDNFDLFTPKPSEKKVTPPKQVSVPAEKDTKPIVPIANSGDNNSKTVNPPSAAKTPVPDDAQSDFDIPVENTKPLLVMNKDRARISSKRRKPTKKGRHAALETNSTEALPSDSVSPAPPTDSTSGDDDLFATANGPSETPEVPSTKSAITTHKVQEKKKMDLMSQLMSEAASKRSVKKPVVQEEKEEDEVDIFSEAAKKDKSQSFSFLSPIESTPVSESLQEKDEATENADNEENEEFFSEPSFKNFRSSISHKDSILNLDDDDDDLFSAIKTPVLPKSKLETPDDDIFGDDSDIFATIQKEKYEMFPSQLYDNEDDDIFGSMDQPVPDKSTATSVAKVANSAPLKKEVEKKPVFDDPLSGLLGDD